MKNLIKNEILVYINDKRKLLVLIVFAFFCGSNIPVASESGMTLFEYALFVMGNHYYLIYFMFMAYLYFCFEGIKEKNHLMRIRIQSIRKEYLSYIISTVLKTTIFVMAHLLIALAVGIVYFNMENKYQAIPLGSYYNDTLNFLFAYRSYMDNPLLALASVTIFLILGLSYLTVVVYIIRMVLGKKAAIVCIGILILDMMIGFKTGVHGIAELFFINNYFILHHVLFLSGSGYVFINIVIMLISLTCGYFLIRKFTGNDNMRQSNLYIRGINRWIYIYSVFFLTVYVGLNIISLLLNRSTATWSDCLLANLIGYSGNHFYWMEFVRYIIYFLIPLFMIGSILEKEKNNRNLSAEIRYGSKRNWNRIKNRNINGYLMFYVIFFGILLGISCILALMVTHGASGKYFTEYVKLTGLSEKTTYYILILSFVLKGMELFLYKNIFLVLYQILNNHVSAYILTFLGFVLTLGIPGKWYISYGCSSIYNLTHKVEAYGLLKTGIVLMGIVLLKCWVVRSLYYYVGRKKYELCNRFKKYV